MKTAGHRRLLQPTALASALTIFAAPAPALAQALTDLGRLPGNVQSTAYAVGVAGDGTVVAGTSYGGENSRAFRWTSSGGMSDIGALPGHDVAEAYGISADGGVIVGYSASLSNYAGTMHAFRWTEGGGMQDLGTLGGATSMARGVSADGNVVVGRADTGSAAHAFRWTSAGGMTDLGTLAGTAFATSVAYAANQDGSVVVGVTDTTSEGVSHAFRWTGGVMSDLGVLPGGLESVATGVSADGAIVVGDSFLSSGAQHVFRWSAGGGMADLGTLGGMSSYDAAISADGNVIVGTSFVSGNGSTRGFRWTEGGGMQSVNDWLAANGVATTTLIAATAQATNEDGSIVVGKLSNSDAYIARVTGGAASGGGSGGSGSGSGAASGGSGIITINDIAQSLHDAAAAHSVVLNGLGVLMNGAGSRPLDRRAPQGKLIVWLGGDWGRDDHGQRDGDVKLGEFGAGYQLDGFQLNGVVGVTGLGQKTLLGGRTNVDSTYVKLEALTKLHGSDDRGLWLALTGTGLWGDADIRRHYLDNGGLVDSSAGRTDAEGYGLRGRVQWEKFFAGLSPYGEISYARTCVDGYTETGGAFPSAFGRLCDDATEARYGFDALVPVAPRLRLTATLEGVHRFEDKGSNVSGQIVGLGAFQLGGARYRQDWVRGGIGIEADVAGSILSVMANATSKGESANVWIAANWRMTY